MVGLYGVKSHHKKTFDNIFHVYLNIGISKAGKIFNSHDGFLNGVCVRNLNQIKGRV